jgi:hypothetical protein
MLSPAAHHRLLHDGIGRGASAVVARTDRAVPTYTIVPSPQSDAYGEIPSELELLDSGVEVYSFTFS